MKNRIDSDAVLPAVALEAQPAAKPAHPARKEILDAAARIIVERGYDACTMRAVATLVNMKAGSIYYHFASKQDIIGEILNLGIEQLYDYVSTTLAAIPEDSPFFDRILAATTAHIASMVGIQKEYMQVYEHFPPVIKRKSRKMREKYARLWYDLFADGVWRDEVDPGIDLKILVPYFLGGLNRIPEWIRSSGASVEQVAEMAATVATRGILIKKAGRHTPASLDVAGR